ncbi:MAG: hypothetical protein RQ760_05535 [Sedimentisphaerales bacterium]|nr:hypothetical protein [Sedimentisphaerales bacterium]
MLVNVKKELAYELGNFYMLVLYVNLVIKNDIGFMKEFAGHLELEGGAKSDISEEAGRTVEKMKGKDRFRDLRQLSGEDKILYG